MLVTVSDIFINGCFFNLKYWSVRHLYIFKIQLMKSNSTYWTRWGVILIFLDGEPALIRVKRVFELAIVNILYCIYNAQELLIN
jgi:hypothetical protein